jgi:hypothetical protein
MKKSDNNINWRQKMKSKTFVTFVIFTFLMVVTVFPQNTTKEDPLEGVWFSQLNGNEYVFIFLDGVNIIFHNDSSDTTNFHINYYTISGNKMIGDYGFEYNFTIVDENRIILEIDGTYLLIRQNHCCPV